MDVTMADAVAMTALTQMQELTLKAGTLVTIDVTTVYLESTSAKIDAVIQCKLFKVLPYYVSAGEHMIVASQQTPLWADTCNCFGICTELHNDVL